MNKTAIKNFAIWARNKLIADISYKAGLMGITEDGVKSALPQSTKDVEFYDIGTKEPYSITGKAIAQRRKLAELIGQKAKASDYQTAYCGVIEEVAYTWFNRLIAIRFMEVNDYLPSRIRVLSSESGTKLEPDLVTTPFDAELELSDYEQSEILRLKNENKVDELFQMLFTKQCNELNQILPKLFETTADYTELLLNVSVTDQDGVVYRLVHDIPEDDFNISKIGEGGKPTGQVEIIGWLYQYYNTEPKDEAFTLLKKNVKITKERIPAATQLFTPDWIVRYMVENSLGRLWLEGHPNADLKAGWKYYLDEAQQEANVQAQLMKIREEYKTIHPEDIKVIDPCMGSGHILVYAFDVLMQIYESAGYTQRDAAKSILEHNLYGLDIDDRAFQLSYFAVMMKARQYNRRILNGETDCHVYAIQESNGIATAPMHDMGLKLTQEEYGKAAKQAVQLVEEFHDAKEYGSILNITPCDWDLLRRFAVARTEDEGGQMVFGIHGEQIAAPRLQELINIGEVLAQKYDVVVTNPPYLGVSVCNIKMNVYVKNNYFETKTDLFAVFMVKCANFTRNNGIFSMITQHSWMFLKSFSELRKQIAAYSIINMAHLGARAFEDIAGEVVQTSSFSIRKSQCYRYKGTYVRLVNFNSQESKREGFLSGNFQYHISTDKFDYIEDSPVAYWVPDKLFEIFRTTKQIGDFGDARVGMQTGENDKFVRLWEEISYPTLKTDAISLEDAQASMCIWFPYNKGGEYRKWYGNNDWVVDWYNDGQKIKNDKLYKLSIGECLPSNSKPKNIQYYFLPSITWSKVSSGSIAFRYKPAGHIFDIAGASIFANTEMIKYLQGYCNSTVAMFIAYVLSPTINYEAGTVSKFPVVIVKERKMEIELLVEKNVQLSKDDWDSFETSWDFTRHPLVRGGSVAEAYAQWEQECADRFNTLKANEEELNRIFIDIYGLQDELTPEEDDKNVTVRKADLGHDTRSLLSYAVGCMFGRYSLDVDGLAYAGRDWDDAKYRTFIPDKDNILPITDEEYFEDDIVGLFCAWLKKVYGADTLEENLDFIAKALGNKGNTSREVIRSYFLNDFFKDHCSTYSVTGSGKRPIYWLFDSGKQNGFKALIYMHRYDENTIGNLRIDYLHRMERIYDSEIDRMQDVIDNSTAAREVTAATKRKEKLQKQVKECKDYDEKIAHLALARIAIDLDDGVKANYRKVQTVDGKFYEVLADSKTIMAKE